MIDSTGTPECDTSTTTVNTKTNNECLNPRVSTVQNMPGIHNWGNRYDAANATNDKRWQDDVLEAPQERRDHGANRSQIIRKE